MIHNEDLNKIAVEEIRVQEMAKRVAAEDKSRDSNARINHAEH